MHQLKFSEKLALFLRFIKIIRDRKADDFAEKAVILVLVVLAGVGAFAAFGARIVDLINQAASGI